MRFGADARGVSDLAACEEMIVLVPFHDTAFVPADRRGRCNFSEETTMRNHSWSTVRAALLTAFFFSFAGFSRPPSKTLDLPRGFEISVREASLETGYTGGTDSVATTESRSSLSHFGRIEELRGARDHSVAVYTDSLLFRSDAPFRFAARISRDTIQVASADDKPAAQTGAIASDENMLRCIFEGPSLRIHPPAHGRSAAPILEYLKSECPGGLYRRLNLPVTIGPFILSIPDDCDHPGSRWQAIVTCPSFSGLGFFPQIRLTYRMIESPTDAEENTIEIACDTTLAHIRATLPSGEAVEIIAHRIRVHGVMRPWQGLPLFCRGKIEIEEEIRYVRPELESPVLEKRCDSEITFAPR